MSWNTHHSRSEALAADAQVALRAGDAPRAERLYRQAAEAEVLALEALAPEKLRTRGITAVSAVALWYKGLEFEVAERLAHQQLVLSELPDFARSKLRELLGLIWVAREAQQSGVKFVSGEVLVSVQGGEVLHGAAPLDLILGKVEGIQATLYRTIEMLLDKPFRKRGRPTEDVASMFRPWLMQAPAGSYQFAVRVQAPSQLELWASARPSVERVTNTFLDVLRASAGDPERELPAIVPDPQYRQAFLSLSRNLAPTGKTFEWLEVRDATDPSAAIASFGKETRQQINSEIRRSRATRPTSDTEEQVTLSGVLRAVHLDKDWLVVDTDEEPPRPVTVHGVDEVLDDIVGPMVNRRVRVATVRRGQKYFYQDIEMEE